MGYLSGTKTDQPNTLLTRSGKAHTNHTIKVGVGNLKACKNTGQCFYITALYYLYTDFYPFWIKIKAESLNLQP